MSNSNTSDAGNETVGENIIITNYSELTGEDLSSTLDISTWDTGVKALQAFDRLEHEIAEAERSSGGLRKAIREQIFNRIGGEGFPKEAGVYKATINDVKEAQNNVLFNAQVEACDANSHVFYTLPMQIIQIAVATVTYDGKEQTWANRIFRRDVHLKGGGNLIDETIEILNRRSGSPDTGGSRPKVTDMMRRGVMTYMERAVLAEKATAPWRMGHGNPLAYEILSGSGLPQLIEKSIPILRKLVLEHKKFLFIPSSTQKEHFLTIGDALEPLEYAIIDDATADLKKITDGGYRGDQYREVHSKLLLPFCKEAGPNVLTGVYRASKLAPARMFYAHQDYVHEAALIALADSMLQDHRGFPMLIDMADSICRTYFGAETLNRPSLAALSNTGESFRYLEERATRAN